ncbi:DUF6090 family protein [[Muricauda] lutisoli]|uniref:Uncharacterized protein n=1 Tax=[Muricauda] lutisoli TaxID=2816035 RepID=A0ABS3EW11_9FLAO|nr:DUF6090 family protein [[Muricauda] lutisoli]MBO0330355.1 hypothetical protein [[Muricauda] lutisoli]
MIQFFRKIRQNLLSERKTGKYLKYAIGEIVLVVIGILIALQINNWNEDKKDLQRAHRVLTNLSEEIRQDSTYFENVYNAEKDIFLHGAEQLFKLHSNELNSTEIDSIGTSFRLACFTPAIKSLNNAYNELMASNLLSHLNSESLKYNLKEYYSQIDFLISYSEQSHQLSNDLIYELAQYYEVVPVKLGSAREISKFSGAAESDFTTKYDLEPFRNNRSLNPKLYDMIDIHKDRLGGLEILRELSIKIQEGILLELKKRQKTQ